MKAIAVIPARVGSTRLPRKVLADLEGHPLLWHVWHRVTSATRLADVLVATDAEEVAAAVRGWGGRAVMTSTACRSGTERIATIASQLDADLLVNVQGDEPLIAPSLIDAIVARGQSATLVTAVRPLGAAEELASPHVVKVARAGSGDAVYFSRSPIPYARDASAPVVRWAHVGIYAYRQAPLAAYAAAPVSPLEQTEQLEQLRFVDLGLRFAVVETAHAGPAVDTLDDLHTVAVLLRNTRSGDR